MSNSNPEDHKRLFEEDQRAAEKSSQHSPRTYNQQPQYQNPPQTVRVKQQTSPATMGCAVILAFGLIGGIMQQCKDASNPSATQVKNTATAPSAETAETVKKLQAVLVELEARGVLKGYKKDSRTYFADGNLWRQMTVPEKEKLLRVMDIVERNGDINKGVSFDVRDYHSNQALGSFSQFAGPTILQ